MSGNLSCLVDNLSVLLRDPLLQLCLFYLKAVASFGLSCKLCSRFLKLELRLIEALLQFILAALQSLIRLGLLLDQGLCILE